jgi:hypothetical protein
LESLSVWRSVLRGNERARIAQLARPFIRPMKPSRGERHENEPEDRVCDPAGQCEAIGTDRPLFVAKN